MNETPFKRKKRFIISEEIALPTPTTMQGVAEAIDAVLADLKQHRVSYDRDTVKVTVNTDGEIVFAYTVQRDEEDGGERPAAAPSPAVMARTTPAPSEAASAPATAPDEGKQPVVPPFPTTPEGDLPELTVEAAHDVVKHGGTFYFRLPEDADNRVATRLEARVRSAAGTWRRKHDGDLLVETKRVRESNALAVTVVR